jgi:hypothetical protein
VPSKQISEAARMLSAKRKTFAGGRPLQLSPCKYCGVPMGTRALRAHQPYCPQKPAKASRTA